MFNHLSDNGFVVIYRTVYDLISPWYSKTKQYETDTVVKQCADCKAYRVNTV